MPLRLRLTVLLLGLLAVALLATGLTVTTQVRSFMTGRQDAELRAASAHLVDGTIKNHTSEKRAFAYVPTNTYAIELRTTDGRLTSLTTDPGNTSAHGPLPAIPKLTSKDPRVRSGHVFSVGSKNADTTWHVVAGTVRSDNKTYVYAVAVSMDHTDEVIVHLELVIVSVALLALLACAALGWFAVRRALRPLREIEDTARSIARGDLTQRVPAPGAQDEVGSLSKSLNVMLARIEDSFAVRRASEDRMRQFVADASHELRTPLATVRGYAELYRQGAVSEPDDVKSAMRRIEDEATRMAVMVDDLLLLTRLERRHKDDTETERPPTPVDLTVLAADTVQDATAIDHDRQVRLRGLHGPVRPTVVLGYDAALRQVLTNLMGNAIRYTPPGSPIEVAVGAANGVAQLQVIDHGSGVPASQRERIFERFYRADVSRNSEHGGSGLGLAIVTALVEAHKGTVEVRDTPGGGATFVAKIPSSPEHTASQTTAPPTESQPQEVHRFDEAPEQNDGVQ
ncbi:two-component sensor histidine kinase [Flexivirga endophytica]|uniref:histidine kinase n=1 Tax=Flexivirga endophytica TaxID=1849103 RepID=A0A916X0H1_9MICO|nr:HAMP domain-containing sensor histidine kinase [Flexivirga endophytica]GGB44121.1 two-component sensor histidine kinase [Flexivirga endophytica]GHB60004.1 two-component sensor histidine kinase [Flexivirga endophytica]